MNFVELILGAVLGLLLPTLLTRARGALGAIEKSRRDRLADSDRVDRFLMRYYERAGTAFQLYDCSISGFEIKIPVLSKPEWRVPVVLDRRRDDLVVMAVSETPGFPVNKRLLRRRARLGQRLFNDATIYLDRIEQLGGRPHVVVKQCQYFHTATSLIRVEEETFRAARARVLPRRTPVRDRCLRDLDALERAGCKPYSVGCCVALALRRAGGYDFVLHVRSSDVITSGGKYALTPNFGLESNVLGARGSGYSLLFYNFLKEYCEELFNQEELIRAARTNRADPDWFAGLPEAAEILEEAARGTFVLEFLGIGVEASTGTTIVPMLARIDDPAAADRVRTRLAVNWEVAARSPGTETLVFVDVWDARLRELHRDRQLTSATAFTLALAQDRLAGAPTP